MAPPSEVLPLARDQRRSALAVTCAERRTGDLRPLPPDTATLRPDVATASVRGPAPDAGRFGRPPALHPQNGQVSGQRRIVGGAARLLTESTSACDTSAADTPSERDSLRAETERGHAPVHRGVLAAASAVLRLTVLRPGLGFAGTSWPTQRRGGAGRVAARGPHRLVLSYARFRRYARTNGQRTCTVRFRASASSRAWATSRVA